MNKILKTLQNIAVIGCICLMAPNSVNAFGLMPPTTFTPVIDIPQAAALITKGGNLKDLLGSVNLSGMGAGFVSGSSGNIFNVVKGFAKNFSKNFAKDKNTSKTPGKGEIRASQQLGISENDKNEAHYFDAYQKLFFIYPSFSDFKSVTEHEGIIQKAYKGKAVEYKQDIIVDTFSSFSICSIFFRNCVKSLSIIIKL